MNSNVRFQGLCSSKCCISLIQNQNALLESPTGTGKTLCLLCASLAWLQTHQAHLQFQISQTLASGENVQLLEEQLKAGAGADQLPPGMVAIGTFYSSPIRLVGKLCCLYNLIAMYDLIFLLVTYCEVAR